MTLAKAIGSRIKTAREKAGLSCRALARLCELNNMSLCGYEHGKNLPGAKAVIALCRALGCSADSLLGLPPVEKATANNPKCPAWPNCGCIVRGKKKRLSALH